MFYVPLDWQSEAACRTIDPAVFFPDDEEMTAAAKAICRTCPVMRECLEYALAANIEHGVWGAASEAERGRIRKTRRFGTPLADERKAEARRLVGMGATVDDLANRLGVSHRQAFRLHGNALALSESVAS